MKKKIFLLLILITLVISCGKKDNPEYKESINIIKIENTAIKIS